MAQYKSGERAIVPLADIITLFGYHSNIATPYTGLYQSGKDDSLIAEAYTPTPGKSFYMTKLSLMSSFTTGNFSVAMGYNTLAITANTSVAPAGIDTKVVGVPQGGQSPSGKHGWQALGGSWNVGGRPLYVLNEGVTLVIPASAGVVYPYLGIFINVAADYSFLVEGFEV